MSSIKESSIQEENLSPEEIKERRDKITKFYKDHIPHLKVQQEYEELLTSIEELRAKRLQAQIFMAQAMSSQEEPSEAAKDFDKVRNLKKDK